MKPGLQNLQAVRPLPRLWVERVWILESREPLCCIRDIPLRPGVNVVWAREPDDNSGSGLASAGHGVGKTSFCLLMRYLLGDDASAISVLRAKAAANFPKGGVAAQVHIEGVSWLVFRPFGASSPSWAKVGNQLEELLDEPRATPFQDYLEALQSGFIGRLPTQVLPGTNQPLEWRHLLAWCVREQRTRFDGFFHWREGEGLGFRRSRVDPPLFVSSVLGILNVEVVRLLQEAEQLDAELNKVKSQIPILEKVSAMELDRLEQRVRTKVGARKELPIFESIVEDSLASQVAESLRRAALNEQTIEAEALAAEQAMEPDLVLLNDLRSVCEQSILETQLSKALYEAREKDALRLRGEIDELTRLKGHCSHGRVDFDSCSYVLSRRSTVSMHGRMDVKDAQASLQVRLASFNKAAEDEKAAKTRLDKQVARVKELRAGVARLRMRVATSQIERDTLAADWKEFQAHYALRAEGKGSEALTSARTHEGTLIEQVNGKRAVLAMRRLQASARVEQIKFITSMVATALLGEEGHGRFVHDSDQRPFELALGGEAYQVLEVLLGDLSCLLDAATSVESHHPGFLVHDCPREADMSALLYRNFLSTAFEADKQLSTQEGVPFQYIVTTTSPPPLELGKDPFLVLELQPGKDEALLFKRKLEVELPGFASKDGGNAA